MAASFDPIAADYDSDFSESPTGSGQRASVYYQLQKLLPVTSHILELNCGTGTDALWLAQQGHQVLATDIAPQMVAETARKIEVQGLGNQVETMVLAAEELTGLANEKPAFDFVFSNFAGLNCVAPEDWPALRDAFAKQTLPDGKLVLVLLGRFCWWETLYFTLKRQWKTAWRRRKRTAVSARLSETQAVEIWYYSPKDIIDFCTPAFTFSAVYPIGLALPPSYLDGWFRNWPRLFRLLSWLDVKLRNWQGGAAFADHYLLVLEKK